MAIKIVASKQTKVPNYGIAADGYTIKSGAPTSYMVRLEGEKRWRRVMELCFSNASTHFLKIKGKMEILQWHDIPSCMDKVLVKAHFDHREWEGEVIGKRSGDFGATMLLVAPSNGSAAVWRDPSNCKPCH